MNAESIVSIITGEESDTNWNDSEEEQEDYFKEESLKVDRLTMELGKMSDIRGSVFYFISLCLGNDGGQDDEKEDGNDGKDNIDFDDSLPGPSGLGTVSEDSGTLDGPVHLSSNFSLLSFLFFLY